MNKNHWILIAFVATMVCNGKCRPREVEVKNIYPVYRSEKQLELETSNRYEKHNKEKLDDDSITYHRIDIPYKNVKNINTTGELVIKNNSKSVINYVPVALTIKKPNIKKWPSDQNGIESPDDLSLYNIYTNNINPLNLHHMTTPGYNLDFPYIYHSKPSILILEELTTKNPSYDYDNVYTQPIQVLDRPPPQPAQIYPVSTEIPRPSSIWSNRPPTYPPEYWSVYKPTESSHPTTATPHPEHNQYIPVPSVEYSYVEYESTTQTPLPASSVDVKPSQEQISTPYYVSTTLQPEVTTKKSKNTRCPNVSIIAITSINNNNSMNKEGCQDINIHISTNVTNSNTGFIRPNKPSNSSVVAVQNDQMTQTGVSGIFDVIWSIFSRIFNFPFLSTISSGALSPFSVFLTGLSTFVLPWLFPHLLLHSARWNRLLILKNDSFRPTKYLKRSLGEESLRDRSIILQPQYMGGRTKKKISRYSSASSSAESEVKVEHENANKTYPKLNIESIATVARASSDGALLASSIALGHTLDTVSQLVESDIRTPPKLKEIIKEKANEQRKEVLSENSTPLPYTFIYEDDTKKFEEKHEMTDKTLFVDSFEGKASNINSQPTTDEGVKGIAIPVVMDEVYELTTPPKKLQKIPELPKPMKEEKKKTAITKSQPTTTPSSGLSTWILLSDNKDVTTPSSKKNNKKEEDKKKAGVATTTKKPARIQATTSKSTTQVSKKTTAKPTNKKSETDVGISALEALVKNQKKGSTTTSKPKISDPKKKLPDRLEIAEAKDKADIELPDYKATYTLPPNLPIITTENKAVTTSTSQTSAPTTTEKLAEGTTKKKSTTKKKKKNKNRRKKPAEDTGVEAKIPSQPVGSQIYNFLSREIVPTVGLGLIGVALTAGLASFLGYNPFGSSTIPLRRTYDTNHGYSPNNYYNYNTDFGDGGQSEEVLFKEVLSGMPEDSRYGLTHTDTNYPDTYNRQDQIYDSMKNPIYPSGSGSMYSFDKDKESYDATYPQDYSTGYGTYDTQDKKYLTEVKEKYPVYSRETGTSFVYPETTGMTSADKTSKFGDDYGIKNTGDKYSQTSPDTIERQPEALYRVASESDLQYRSGESTIQGVSSQNSWHRIGSPMEPEKPYSSLKPGPRSLDLGKESAKTDVKKRSKRAAESVIQRISRKRTKKENDVENEIDFNDSFIDSNFSEPNFLNEFSTTISSTKTTAVYLETTTSSDTSTATNTVSSTEEVKEVSSTEPTYIYDSENDSTAPPPSGISILDVLKRLAQFKLRLGLNFLRSTTDLFSRYLDDIQRRVDESFANTTTTTVQYNKRTSPWSRIFFSKPNDDDDESYRRKRSLLEDNQFLGTILSSEDSMNNGFPKSTKKDLRLPNKIFYQKKNMPKKYESKRTN